MPNRHPPLQTKLRNSVQREREERITRPPPTQPDSGPPSLELGMDAGGPSPGLVRTGSIGLIVDHLWCRGHKVTTSGEISHHTILEISTTTN
jgi:hypothetical protein